MVTVLYTRKDSIYKKLAQDCWDSERDANKWPGGNAIIAHPPCRGWGRLRQRAKIRRGEKQLAIHAIIMIRLYGGVLEHPDASRLWKEMNLPQPGQFDQYGGWTLSVNQNWWGHRAEKRTWLYIRGCRPREIPDIPIRFDTVEKKVDRMGTKERESTPVEMAKWLIKLAEICNTELHNGLQKRLT